jgi:hypothetical protein
VPVSIAIGKPIWFKKEDDVEQAEIALRSTMIAMLHEVQESYPDGHSGQWWAPVRLGGTAPAPLNS